MGGKAFGFESKRLDAETYNVVVEDVIGAFDAAWGSNPRPPKLLKIPSYRNKASFGDADLIFTGTPAQFQAVTSGYEAYAPNPSGHVYSNGSVFSFGVLVDGGVFQVDLIYGGEIESSSSKMMRTYFAYNDLGNLMGRVAHRIGLKWGQDGLSYVLRDESCHTRVLGEFNLTEAIGLHQSFSILGYDYLRWTSGFDDLADIFEFVASSKYFSPEIYLLHNRNSISRARDSKRETYKRFLKWCEEKDPTRPNVDLEDDGDHVEYKRYFLHTLCNDIPEFSKWYHSTLAGDSASRLASTVIGGHSVSAITGASGKDLGIQMSELRRRIDGWVNTARGTYGHNSPKILRDIWIFENKTQVEEFIRNTFENT